MEIILAVHDILIYKSQGYVPAPMTFGPYSKMPFSLANFGSGEVISKKECASCLDSPFDFNDRFRIRKVCCLYLHVEKVAPC